MHSKRILIVGNGELLIAGLLPNLQDQGMVQVFQINGNDTGKIRAEIQQVVPDVILLDGSYTSSLSEILFQLPDNQKIHVIIINTKDNNLQIIDTQYIEIQTMADFINVL